MVASGIALLPLLASSSLASPSLGVCFYFLHAVHLCCEEGDHVVRRTWSCLVWVVHSWWFAVWGVRRWLGDFRLQGCRWSRLIGMLSNLWVVLAMVWLLGVSAAATTLWYVVAFGGDMTVACASNGGCAATRVDNDIKHDDELGFFHPGILFLILTLSKTNLLRFLWLFRQWLNIVVCGWVTVYFCFSLSFNGIDTSHVQQKNSEFVENIWIFFSSLSLKYE